ncbi:flagellin [Methylobacterium terricola]|uniref:Flagellin n=1 Tax=Methylobacterium terricola TaxID=2583531 RepID=A0A5C4LD14_9HYPH|nr:flagellin [Methylobacterium terricola]TNC11296.1 flagellin [Methylobacterium terricola]
MNYDVTLSAASRQNLLSLQDAASLTAQNQTRLSTGKKVNSALDNPVNYFTANGLNNRADALSGLLDGISNNIQTIQAASKGIDAITSQVKQLQSTIKQAQSNAAQNLPKVQGAAVSGGASGIANVTEAAATGKSQRDTALAKNLIGAAAQATSGSAGVVGIAAATGSDTNVFRIQSGSTTYEITMTATSTVSDLVNGINKSGLATASVDNNGQLVVTGQGSDPLTLVSGTKTTAGAFTAVAADTNSLFGTGTQVAAVNATTTSAVRSSLINQFNDVRTQIDQLAKDASFNGTNLLQGDKMTVAFNEKTGSNASKLDVQGTLITSTNLGIGTLVDSSASQAGLNYGVQNNSDLSKAADALTNVLTSLTALSSTLGQNLATVQTRQDFTKQLSNVLSTGADNLTNADMNEEAANSQALSTRQSLGISALSLANQANQGILQLLR